MRRKEGSEPGIPTPGRQVEKLELAKEIEKEQGKVGKSNVCKRKEWSTGSMAISVLHKRKTEKEPLWMASWWLLVTLAKATSWTSGVDAILERVGAGAVCEDSYF